MQATIDKIDCTQMINEILEDGDKLRSLRQLMSHYQLSIPFKAYKARGDGAGQVFELVEFVKAGQRIVTPCSVCGGGILADEGGNGFVTTQMTHKTCPNSAVDAGGWCPDAENWKLA